MNSKSCITFIFVFIQDWYFKVFNSWYFRSRIYPCIFHGSTRQALTRLLRSAACAVTKKYKLACWIFEKSLKVTEFIMAYNFYADLKAAIENPSCAVSYFHTEKHFELSCSNRFRMRRLLRRVFKMATFCGAHVHTILTNSRAMC